MDARRALARFGVVALLLGLVAAGLALLAHSGHLGGDAGTPAALGLATGLLGSLILWYRPGNRMGQVLTVTGLLFGLVVLAGGVLDGGAVPSWLRQAALGWAWLAGAMSVPWMLFVLWFPDGRFTSRAWQRFFVVAAAATLTLAVTGYLASPPGGRLPAQFSVRRAPIGLAGPLGVGSSNPLVDLSDVASLLLPLVAVLSLVQRYRRAGTLVRQQVKWLLAGTAATIIGSAASVVLQSAGGAAHGVGVALLVAVSPLPVVAATVAVLRYRLWEIDLVVSKAVVYAVLWALLSIVILVPALATGVLVGGSSALTAVGVALAVTALFQPVRSRLERVVERVVYRDRPRGYALLSRFSQSLRATADMGHLAPHLAETVRSGLGVAWAGVWIYVASEETGSLRPVGTAGAAEGPSLLISPSTHAQLLSQGAAVVAPQGPEELRALGGEEPALVVPLVTGEELVGVLACGQRPGDPLGEVDLELLGVIGREAALALANLRLEAQLRQRLAQIEDQATELRHSRQRLVGAQDGERRRMERDLHDGVQQQLVSLSVQLRRAAIARPIDAHHLLAKVASEAEEAVFALQELGRGIFPSVLADQGLPAALRTQASRVPMAIHVEVAPSVARRRFDPELEAALYFVGLEAMTNAQKHAPQAAVTISLRYGEDSRAVVLEVHDDGPGIQPQAGSPGTGLQNMQDRLSAVGGELRIDTRPGGGTWVRAQAPLPADVLTLQPEADSRR